MHNTRVYISGPITGITDNNASAFEAAEKLIASIGLVPVSPLRNCPMFAKWAEYMRFNIPRMLQCDCVYAIPNWRKSKGARIEIQLALDLDLSIRFDIEGLQEYSKSLC